MDELLAVVIEPRLIRYEVFGAKPQVVVINLIHVILSDIVDQIASLFLHPITYSQIRQHLDWNDFHDPASDRSQRMSREILVAGVD